MLLNSSFDAIGEAGTGIQNLVYIYLYCETNYQKAVHYTSGLCYLARLSLLAYLLLFV